MYFYSLYKVCKRVCTCNYVTGKSRYIWNKNIAQIQHNNIFYKQHINYNTMYIKVRNILRQKSRQQLIFLKCEKTHPVFWSVGAPYNRYLQKFVTTTVSVSYCINLKTAQLANADSAGNVFIVTQRNHIQSYRQLHKVTDCRLQWERQQLYHRRCSLLGDSRSLLLSNGTTTGGGDTRFAGEQENRKLSTSYQQTRRVLNLHSRCPLINLT